MDWFIQGGQEGEPRIHDVFHVSLLRPYDSDAAIQPPPPILIEGQDEYEVDRILEHRDRHLRKRGLKTEYLIRWLGYGPEHNCWEPEANLQGCPKSVQQYWKSLEEKQATHAKVSWGNRRRIQE